jgi:hypothetical protein
MRDPGRAGLALPGVARTRAVRPDEVRTTMAPTSCSMAALTAEHASVSVMFSGVVRMRTSLKWAVVKKDCSASMQILCIICTVSSGYMPAQRPRHTHAHAASAHVSRKDDTERRTQHAHARAHRRRQRARVSLRTLGSLARQHDTVGAVQHRIGHVRDLGARRPRVRRHAGVVAHPRRDRSDARS